MKKNKLIFALLLASSLAYGQTPSETKSVDPLEEAIKANGETQSKTMPTVEDVEKSAQEKPAMRPQSELKIVPVKTEEKKTTITSTNQVIKLTKEESDLLKNKFRPLSSRPDLMKEIEDEKKQMNPIYVPAPSRDKTDEGFVVERDSTKVISKKMSVNDSMNLKICFNAGVQITLDEDITTTLQTVILDDKIFFDAVPFDNNRGAYVRLKQPVPEGMYWESSIRMVRKSDDKSYLINLYALPCPAGVYPFPKMVYLKEKHSVLNKTSKVLTPEDTIIALSQGMPRVQKNRIRVYDMVASSGSDWVVFGVEVQFPNRKTTNFEKDLSKYFKILDNLQINNIGTAIEYLPIQSDKATQARGVSTMRFKVSVNIDKNYILNNRFLHLMYVDKEEDHYQYVRVDTVPYFLSLKKRGFEL